jgi:uncharacterized protein (DUF1501 family)
MSRRHFLMGCSGTVAAMAGAQLTGLTVAAAAPGTDANNETLIVLFLRGGWDAINVTPPLMGSDRAAYEAARPYLKVPTVGKNAALPLNNQFGLHRGLEPLLELYQGRQLAIIQAVGLLSANTRSHFDAMRYMELGTTQPGTTTGWISRYLQANTAKLEGRNLPAVTIDAATTASLLGSDPAIALRSIKDFLLVDDPPHRQRLLQMLGQMYQGEAWLHKAGQRTISTIRLVEQLRTEDYRPAAPYPAGELGDRLKTLAALLKQGLNLRVATIDLGGWDTHEWQGENGEGQFADLLRQLGGALAAFYKDMNAANLTQKLTIVVMSEFGRRLAENASRGTDHGHGGTMLVLGGKVNGGQLYGRWPGLDASQLYDRADLAVTTDYRTVLAEILKVQFRTENPTIFPGFRLAQPLGLIRG